MFAIIAEDDSDAKSLQILIRRITEKTNIKVLKKGYSGCPDMLRKGTKQLNSFVKMGATHLIVCADRDKFTVNERTGEVQKKIFENVNFKKNCHCCIVVPCEEIEAWILADLDCLNKVFKSWSSNKKYSNPESVDSPKEELIRLSRMKNKSSRPLYSNGTHNEKIFAHISLDELYKKCPSYRTLHDFVAKAC